MQRLHGIPRPRDRAMEPSPFPHVENHHWVREQTLKKSLSLQVPPIFPYFAKPGFPIFASKQPKQPRAAQALTLALAEAQHVLGAAEVPLMARHQGTQRKHSGIIHWLCFFRFWVTSSEKNPTWQGQIHGNPVFFFGIFTKESLMKRGC